MRNSHFNPEKTNLNPEKTNQILQDLCAGQATGFTWVTFKLTLESFAESPQRLGAALQKARIPVGPLRALPMASVGICNPG